MRLAVKRCFLLNFLILNTLLLARSLLVTGEKMEKSVDARDAGKLSGVVITKHKIGRALDEEERSAPRRPPPAPRAPRGPNN